MAFDQEAYVATFTNGSILSETLRQVTTNGQNLALSPISSVLALIRLIEPAILGQDPNSTGVIQTLLGTNLCQASLCTRPQGNRFLLSAKQSPADLSYNVWSINSDGSGLTAITSDGFQNTNPQWHSIPPLYSQVSYIYSGKQATNEGISFALSGPISRYAILATSCLGNSNWSFVCTVTNVSGMTHFSISPTNANSYFYRAKPVP